jgi:hypothetical protein
MSNEAIDALRQKVAELESEAKLRDQVARLETRIRGGISPGSPQAMRVKEPPRPIAGGGGDDWERVRDEFQRLGQYEKM